ncbi:MAG TPA: glycosyltransferase family 39 protein [Chloroflexia bacterium]|nr:glycosyltransferase family 39 protein [Chloroflexia bacterium]
MHGRLLFCLSRFPRPHTLSMQQASLKPVSAHARPAAAPATPRVRTRSADLAAVGALALAGALTRLPFVRETPVNWDAVQLALALDRFDLRLHQPHPPGYILYVALGRALDWAVGSPAVSLALLSALFGAAALPLLYLLAMRVFDDRAISWGAALVVGASPLALYYGATGLTYVPEMALGIAVALAAWRTRAAPRPAEAALLGALLGVAGGIRQTGLAVLLPLCVWALWRASWGARAAFAGVLAAVCAAWAVPLVAASGGIEAYLRESALLAEVVSENTSLIGAGLAGPAYNLAFIGLALIVGLGVAVVPLGLWAARLLRFSLARPVRDFLALWALPPLLMYALTHVGQYGYLLVVLPPLAILSAAAARVTGETLVARGKAGRLQPTSIALAICGAAALFSAGYFVSAEGPTTASNISHNHDRWQHTRAALARFDPANTVLVMEANWAGPFRLAGYLLPEFRSYALYEREEKGEEARWAYSAHGGRSDYALPHPAGTPRLQLPPGTENVLVLDQETAQRTAVEQPLERIPLDGQGALYRLNGGPGEIRALDIREGRLVPVYEGEAGNPATNYQGR